MFYCTAAEKNKIECVFYLVALELGVLEQGVLEQGILQLQLEVPDLLRAAQPPAHIWPSLRGLPFLPLLVQSVSVCGCCDLDWTNFGSLRQRGVEWTLIC